MFADIDTQTLIRFFTQMANLIYFRNRYLSMTNIGLLCEVP